MQVLRALRYLVWYSFVLFGVLVLMSPAGLLAQTGNSGTLSGAVKDPSAAVVANATVSIADPVSGYMRVTNTGSAGDFSFPNVPFNTYHLVVTAPGFANTGSGHFTTS